MVPNILFLAYTCFRIQLLLWNDLLFFSPSASLDWLTFMILNYWFSHLLQEAYLVSLHTISPNPPLISHSTLCASLCLPHGVLYIVDKG